MLAFLRKKSNREVLSWLGGGAVVVAAGIWTVVTFLYSPQSAKSAAPAASVTADCSGIAIGGNAEGATITGGSATDCKTGSD